MTARIAVTGARPAMTRTVSDVFAQAGWAVLDGGESDMRRARGFAAVRRSLLDFEHRTETEARHSAFVSDGSVLRAWAQLHAEHIGGRRRYRRLPTELFLGGYGKALAGIVIRHARATYTEFMHVSPPSLDAAESLLDRILLDAIHDTGLPYRVCRTDHLDPLATPNRKVSR